MNKELLLDTLGRLDPKDDGQWTTDGLPKLEAVRWLSKDQSFSRADIQAVAPNFSRENISLVEDDNADQTGAWAGSNAVGDGSTEPTEETAPAAEGNGSQAEELEREIREIKRFVENRRRDIEECKEQITKAEEELVTREAALHKLIPQQTSQDAIRSYLDGQVKLNEERAAHITAFKESGFDIKQFLPPGASRLDQALAARKRKV
jgi:TolA-binding protein